MVSLELIHEALESCYRCYCGCCKEGCPMYQELLSEIFSPRGVNAASRALLKGIANISDNFIRSIYSCTQCRICSEFCKFTQLKPPNEAEIVRFIRKELITKGYVPTAYNRIATNISELGNPYGEDRMKRFSFIEGRKLRKFAKILYFVGCTTAYRASPIAIAMVNILEAAGENFTIIKDESCCAGILIRLGFEDIAKQMIKLNFKSFKAAGVETIITSCPGCYSTFKELYPEFLDGFDFNVMHSSEYIEDLIENGKIGKFKPLAERATYHDPCHLGRYCGIYSEPRSIISSIPELEFIEMKKCKNMSVCCGAGAGVKATFPELALKIASRRISQALEIGAGLLITACPFCVINFRDALMETSMQIKITDITQLVWNSLK